MNDSENLATGQQIITASAFIHHNFNGIQKVFLPKRAKNKKFLPDAYELPGGHIDFNEDITAGLKREISEELRMQINVGDPFGVFTYQNHIKGSHSIEVIYFATFIDPIDKIRINPNDHSEYNWFAENEISAIAQLNRENEDPEIKVINKGFTLLKGSKLNFG